VTAAALLAALGLVARLCTSGQAAPLPSAAAGSAPDVELEAGAIARDTASGVYLLEQGVLLRRGAVTLRSRAARFDPRTGEVAATGEVLLTDVGRVVAAEGLRAVLGGSFQAEGVVAFLKDGALDLSGAATLEAARAAGTNRLSLSGASVRGEATGRLLLEGARLTLCDCGDHAPSWEIRARSADVVPGERAILSRPVLRVTPRFLFIDRPVPVLALPWLYVPLADRRTGLLLPQIESSGATGLGFALPLFVTLGRSADLTFTAGYAVGRGEGDAASVEGPSARLELRWAPAVGTEGVAEITWLHDLADERVGVGGDRYAVELRHAQRLSDRTSLRADVALFGDPFLPRDFTADLLARTTPYRRSDVLLTHRRDLGVLELDAAYLQPLAGRDAAGYGTFGAEVDVLHRLPAFSATLLPLAAGPLRVEGRAGLARFAPVQSLAGRSSLGGAQVDALLRAPVSRADARAELALPLVAGGVSLEPFVRGAALAYALEGGGARRERAWAVGGARLSATATGTFGAVRHRVTPRLVWLAGTPAGGDGPGSGYDLFDREDTAPIPDPASPAPPSLRSPLAAAPEGRFHQLRVSLENRLEVRGAEALRVEVGQDLDLERSRLAETFLSGAVRAGRFSADAEARFLAFDARPEPAAVPLGGAGATPPPRSALLDRFTELRAQAAVSSRRGDALRAGLVAIGAGASGTLVAGLDALFDLAPAPLFASAQGSAGARIALGPGALGYDVLFPGRRQRTSDAGAATPFACPGESRTSIGPLHVQQHVGSFTWDSPCRCFRVVATVGVTRCGEVSGGFSLDLAGLGSRAPIR
jgi:LPS-assembly protein